MYVLSRHFCYCPGTVRDKCFLFISVYVYIAAFIVISPPLYLIPSSLCVSTQASIVRDGDHYVINGRKWSARLFTERVLCLHFTSLFLPCWKNLLITPLSLVHLFLSFFLSLCGLCRYLRWISGAMDPRCRMAIFMGKTSTDGPLHKQQSMVR